MMMFNSKQFCLQCKKIGFITQLMNCRFGSNCACHVMSISHPRFIQCW